MGSNTCHFTVHRPLARFSLCSVLPKKPTEVSVPAQITGPVSGTWASSSACVTRQLSTALSPAAPTGLPQGMSAFVCTDGTK